MSASEKKIPQSAPPRHFPRRACTAGMILAGLAAYCLTLLLPLPEDWAFMFRHGYSLWLLGALLVLVPLYGVSRAWGRTMAFSLTLVLFALPLAGLWRVGFGEMQIIGGLLSFSDSARYYYEANRLLAGLPMTGFGARHPFAPGLLAVTLWLVNGNLQWTLALWVGLNAAAVYIAARALQQTHGVPAAALFVLLAFLFYRRFAGMTDTENVGFLLGMLAFSCLWQGAHRKDSRLALAGLFLSAMALNTRPGAMLMLPALLFWFLRTFTDLKRLLHRKIFWQAAGVLAAAFVLNGVLASLLSAGDGSLFSNYAFTLYGIADGGSGWEKVFMDHPEIRLVSEDQAAKLSFQFAMEKLWNNPVPALQSAVKSLGDFFSVKDASAFGFVSGGDLTAFDHPLPEHELTYLITRLVLWGLSLAGVYPVWQTRRDALTRLQFWAVVGMIASVPFAPPRDAALMRVYAAVMPFLFMLPLMGLAYLCRRMPFALQTQPAQKISPRWGWGLGMALVILMSVGPLLLRWLQPVPGISTFSCPAEPVSAVIRVRQGSYLAVTADTEQERSRLPVIRQEDFLAALRQFPYGMAIRDLGTLTPPVWIMNAIDLRSGQMLWVVLPVDILPAVQEDRYDALFGVCGDWMPGMQANGLGFLQVRSLYPLDAAPMP